MMAMVVVCAKQVGWTECQLMTLSTLSQPSSSPVLAVQLSGAHTT